METLHKEVIDFIDECLGRNPNQFYAIEAAMDRFNLSEEQIGKMIVKPKQETGIEKE
jgi:hypothetical protein